jgi:hypothetical protein
MIWVLQSGYYDLCWCTTDGTKASSGVAFTVIPDTGSKYDHNQRHRAWARILSKGAITPDSGWYLC